ncbi:MAG: hypothetical protein QXF56_01055 [Candidatus Micrarchaeia archaeon]
MSFFNKAQISLEFYIALSAVLLLFLFSLIFAMQLRKNEEERQIATASHMLAQQVANSVDLMQRNLCYEGNCTISLLLPKRIRGVSFPKEVEYNITFHSNWVVVTPAGYPSASVASAVPFEGLKVSLEEKPEGKFLRVEGAG